MKKIITVLVLIILAACSKDDSNPTEAPKTTTVYVGGSELITSISNKPIATIWINDVPTHLSTPLGVESYVNAVFIDGENVYAVGVQSTNNFQTAVLWKNGVKTTLSQLESKANDIYVQDGKPYIVGEVENKAILWYDNTSLTFSNGQSIAKSIKIYNDRLYIAGNITNTTAGVWKSIHDISSSTSLDFETYSLSDYSYASGIEVKDNYFYTGLNIQSGAKIVKGLNTIYNLGDYTRVNDVAFLNQDIISIGRSDINQTGKATVWKNDTPTFLSNNSSLAEDLYIIGSDIYIAGSEIVGSTLQARLWINGEMKLLSEQNSLATSVFVTQK